MAYSDTSHIIYFSEGVLLFDVWKWSHAENPNTLWVQSIMDQTVPWHSKHVQSSVASPPIHLTDPILWMDVNPDARDKNHATGACPFFIHVFINETEAANPLTDTNIWRHAKPLKTHLTVSTLIADWEAYNHRQSCRANTQSESPGAAKVPPACVLVPVY